MRQDSGWDSARSRVLSVMKGILICSSLTGLCCCLKCPCRFHQAVLVIVLALHHIRLYITLAFTISHSLGFIYLKTVARESSHIIIIATRAIHNSTPNRRREQDATLHA